MANSQFFPLAASQQNLQRLLSIRMIVFACQLVALLYTYLFLSIELNYALILSTMVVFVLINGSVFLRLAKPWPITDPEFLGHLLLDIVGLSILLYLTGGANNPFVSYYLVPITIAAAILPWAYTWALAALCLLCYSLLLFFYLPLPALMAMDMSSESIMPGLHVMGMWFNFLVSAGLITYFVVKMAATLREQQNKLTRYREDNLRDEQILAVAIQAAGTAHELGTPLNTVAILVKEMANEQSSNPELTRQLGIIEQQITRCKNSLRELVNQADFREAGKAKTLSLQDFIHLLMNQWQLIRPEIKLTLNMPESEPSPSITTDATLQQAIINILNNAADASPNGVEVNVQWDRASWTLKVRDYGEGLNDELAEQLGSAIITTKEHGLGVGLVLSQASINRLNGTVKLYRHVEQGAVTEVTLPLQEPEHGR
ncbi:MAG: ATP-binding protein [SAR86 cluster bacterium]|uniref:histidine kinase n=1 Tax=SAR86 cluster bacterium TaxID=2030880 RepID=A0A2A5CFI3_9GAMM|nr:MAG: ATP-binding protein [SAR86 cluster bacterium]